MKRRVQVLQEYSIPLIAGVLLAILWANASPETYHEFVHFHIFGDITVHYLVQDVFMVFFFATAAVEIVEALQPGGALNPIRRAVNPLIATAGGVMGPIAVYLLLNSVLGAPEYLRGWGIPTATDIAIAWLVGKMVFGANHPAIKFLLLLAIVDDAIGLVIIAVFYPDPTTPVEPMWLLLCLAGMIIAFILNRLKVKNYWPYLLSAGVISWLGMSNAHIHPALALVIIVPFFPTPPRSINADLFVSSEDDKRFALTRFMQDWKPIVDFGLFFFGLANAGVQFSSMGTPTFMVAVALIIGKMAGVFGLGYLAIKIGFALPNGMGKRDLLVAGSVAGIGLTVALFMCSSAFVDPVIQGAAKMGALFSVASAPIALIFSKILRIKKYKHGERPFSEKGDVV